MQRRRDFLQMVMAAGALGAMPRGQAFAQDRFDQDALLAFYPVGTITLMHFSDLRGQVAPMHLRAPSSHIGRDGVPHLVGEAFRIRYGVGGRTPLDYAYTHEDFARHAGYYGPLGGADHMVSIADAIRHLRPGAVVLDGGDDFAAQFPAAGAMAPVHAALGTDLRYDTSASQVNMIERGDTRFAVLVPHQTPRDIQKLVDQARAAGAGAVICLSRQGFEADRAIAQATTGLDIILSGGGFHALPEAEEVAGTRIIASGSHGCFVARIDLEVTDGKVTDFEHRLIPVFSDLIRPSGRLTTQAAAAQPTLGTAATLMFRRDAISSPWDDVICHALMRAHDTQIALTPGYRWGASLLAGAPITQRSLQSVTKGPPPATMRRDMTGQQIKERLEVAAEAAFGARGRLDMLRAGGLAFSLDEDAAAGSRILDLRLKETGAALNPGDTYGVAIWDPAETTAKGESILQVLTRYVRRQGRVGDRPASDVKRLRYG